MTRSIRNMQRTSDGMDWTKVVEKLRWFGSNAIESYRASLHEYGGHARTADYQKRADFYYMLAACLEAGICAMDQESEKIASNQR